MPVGEVVARPEVRRSRRRAGPAEVRRLVPAVAGRGQPIDDLLEVALHRVGLARKLIPEGMGEARPRLGLELVARKVVRLERERLVEVAVEIGGALAGNAVDEVERDVVKTGITESVERAPDVIRLRGPLEHFEQPRREALRAERDARDPAVAQQRRRAPASPSPGSPRPSPRPRAGSDASSRASASGRVNVGVPPPRKIVSSGSGEQDRAFELELREQRVDVAVVLALAADGGDEVAVAAAMRAERQVHVEVADHFFGPSSRLSTARNASCGTSTPPTCFIRFLPFFCFSSSLRLRVMSPP